MSRAERILKGIMVSAVCTAGLTGARLLHIEGLPSTPNPLAYYSTRPFSPIHRAPATAAGDYVLRMDRYCGTMTATECSADD